MTSETRTIGRFGTPRRTGISLRLPRSLTLAICMVAGIWLSDSYAWTAFFSLSATGLFVVLAVVFSRYGRLTAEAVCLALAMIGMGASLWTVRNSREDGRDIGVLAEEEHIRTNATVRVTGIIANIPALDSVVDSRPASSSSAQQPRTLFLVRVKSLNLEEGDIAVRGICRVLVDGDATAQMKWGDRVELTGQIDLAEPPMNPGEFDYATHLRRRGISAMMSLRHPAAIRIIHSSSWHPLALLTEFRQQTVTTLKRHLSTQNRATAEALLLGNRGHLTPDVERDFVASGTMHLLAISGLHVGILYIFLMRIMNMLLVPRTQALLAGGFVCVLYCLLTDLRPSVMRSTVFIMLHILGQITCRDLRMGSLIGATTLIMICFDPAIAFDVGAWLSFLAVGALGWVSFRTPPREDRATPLDALTWQDQLRDFRAAAGQRLSLIYRQTVAVTLLSAPLVATQFHLVSLTGMLINVVLIPLTGVALISGYIFIAVGTIVPWCAPLPGYVFNGSLSLLNSIVSGSADLRIGSLVIPDLPSWFLPFYYGLLIASSVVSNHVVQQCLRLSIATLVTALLWFICQPTHGNELVCTVLSVGHGNAVIVETPEGKVLVFDAGALNRGERTADLICRFLWCHGHRMIDAIVISHADMDHYNAVASLLDRLPVAQIIVTRQFARSEAGEVHRVLEAAEYRSVPCSLVQNGDSVALGQLAVDFLQADLGAATDNANSLVAILKFKGSTICLPGDLEGDGQRQLLSSLPRCDFLMSPHHGSLASNSRILANVIRPELVVVSSRADRLRASLEQIYSESAVRLTYIDGAVCYRVTLHGETTVERFREQ